MEKLSNSITSVPAWGTIQTAVRAGADGCDPASSPTPKAVIGAAKCAVKQKHEAQQGFGVYKRHDSIAVPHFQ